MSTNNRDWKNPVNDKNILSSLNNSSLSTFSHISIFCIKYSEILKNTIKENKNTLNCIMPFLIIIGIKLKSEKPTNKIDVLRKTMYPIIARTLLEDPMIIAHFHFVDIKR